MGNFDDWPDGNRPAGFDLDAAAKMLAPVRRALRQVQTLSEKETLRQFLQELLAMLDDGAPDDETDDGDQPTFDQEPYRYDKKGRLLTRKALKPGQGAASNDAFWMAPRDPTVSETLKPITRGKPRQDLTGADLSPKQTRRNPKKGDW